MADKFTPGEWTVLPEEMDKPYIRIRGARLGGRYKIANVINPNTCQALSDQEAEETRANAKLIAAAPNLLKVLIEAAETLESCRYSEMPMAKKCRSIIAKALGEPS
jgi:hypothetical protein